MKYRFIESHRNTFAVRTMCRVLRVSASGYYGWTQRPESQRSKKTQELKEAIKAIHDEYYETYGSPRIADELRKRGLQCSRSRVARLMRSMGLRAKAARKFKVTTDSNHNEPIARTSSVRNSRSIPRLRSGVATSHTCEPQAGGSISRSFLSCSIGRSSATHSATN